MANNIKIVAIEGNIGAGKSTVINKLIETYPNQYDGLLEDVNKWTSIQSLDNPCVTYNALQKMYEDPGKYFVLFQNLVNSSRVLAIQEKIKDNNAKFLVCERDVYSGVNFFAPLQKQKGNVTDFECTVLHNVIDYNIRHTNTKADVLIYLKTSPEMCMDRVRKRNRNGESKVEFDFLQQLHCRHEQFFKQYSGDFKIIEYNYNDKPEKIVDQIVTICNTIQ